MVDASALNADAHSALINRAALDAAIGAQGVGFQNAITDAHAHLFADVAVFVTTENVKQMQAVIAAVEEGVKFQATVRPELVEGVALGVFYGYDFHLNAHGAHLIEINTNAGGAFLNTLLIESQGELLSRGVSPVHASTSSARTDEVDLEQTFLEMFRNEWRLARGDAPLTTIAIVDEQPASQYLYPEFLLAKAMFERAGINAHIVDPLALQVREEGLYVGNQKIDLIYNRLTDFSLQQFPDIRHAHEKQQVVLTPNPSHYQRYADKRKLAWLSDDVLMRSTGMPQASIDVLIQGIPLTKLVNAVDAEQWWAGRKQWFFKPVNGYGSKGAYRGDKITKRVFEEIMSGDYVAQKLAVPGERSVLLNGEAVQLKYDARCYVYDGNIQLIAARLYQGQTTNFRTLGGGFATVRVVE
ncbi:MAG: hypothetical protein HOO95_09015 [Gallionella sp.]|nr:hypothetical protein [Gallionella sp.]